MVRDITDRKEAERELDFQKSALDEHAIVSIADVKGNITYINDKFCEISGYSREELLGQNHRIVKSDEHSSEFYENFWRTIAGGKPWQGVFKNLNKGGGEYWVDATIVPFLGENGKPFQYVAIRTDITERVKAKEEAEAANNAKSEFLSSMSHELRTPLNAIIGFSQLLESDPGAPLSGDQQESVGQIMKGGEHLLVLINEILDLAKIESGQMSISLEPLDPADALASSLAIARALANKYDVTINDRSQGPEPYSIRVDQSRFKQVLLNLLSNAVKYNRRGGDVTLTCERRDDDYMRFSVIDTGLGIASEIQDQLFVPFHRLHAEGGEIEGTGIGLAITRKLVELMGGDIGFTSTVGQGSTFWVEFPLVNEDSASAEATAQMLALDAADAPADAATGTATVLYIEDNPANLKLLEKVFQRLSNVRMISAHTAELGLVMAAQEMPDLILMDINLPGMNGDEALKQIQASDTLCAIPVIAVSANAMDHDIEKAMQIGFRDYITKPFKIDQLLATVRAALEKTQP